MKLPIIRSRRLNKLLCLAMLSMAVLFLAAGGVYALRREKVLAEVMCVLSAIWGLFALFYGILWLIYAAKERNRQRKIERAAQLLAEPDDHSVSYREFLLPWQSLTSAARHRFRKFAAAMAVTALAVFAVLYTVLLFANGFGGYGHLLLTTAFCVLIAIPGTLVQYVIYRRYVRSIPHRILLFPGKLIIDEWQLIPADIEQIIVSSARSANRESPALYRKLRIRTDRVAEYTIDYRAVSGDGPHWETYEEFLTELRKWADQNRVQLTVDYMD